jgi:general stress protein 26
MASKRGKIEMTDEELVDYLENQKILNIATINPSGHPHLVAMWYVMLDGKPAFWTFGKSQKVMNLRRDAKITGLVESGDSYSELRGAELVGTGRLVEDFDEIVRIGTAVAVKYNGPAAASGPGLDFIRKQAEKRIGVIIDVDKAVTWDHTKLGGAY